jgi:hypothetical protein
MAKITCCKSGIEFNCDHFPIAFSQLDELHHPIFSAPLKRLFRYFPKWQAGELTETDSYLYFLALLNATEMCEFRTSANYTRHNSQTAQIVNSNMESLFYTIGRIITIRHPRFVIPTFVISSDTCDLTNVSEWIKCWESAYYSFCNGLKDQVLRSKLERKESALERLIKNPALKPQKYAHILADWASSAASFPSFQIRDQNGNETSIDSYWRQIIQLCYQKESLLSVPESDIAELLAHCEENLDLGSIQSYHLFNTIREGLQTVQGFYGSGPTVFSILNDSLSESDAIGDAQLQLIINDAPKSKPLRTAFATEFAFFKAMSKYNMAQGYSK